MLKLIIEQRIQWTTPTRETGNSFKLPAHEPIVITIGITFTAKKQSCFLWSFLIYWLSVEAYSQGWDYLAFSSPSAPQPCILLLFSRSIWVFFCILFLLSLAEAWFVPVSPLAPRSINPIAAFRLTRSTKLSAPSLHITRARCTSMVLFERLNRLVAKWQEIDAKRHFILVWKHE